MMQETSRSRLERLFLDALELSLPEQERYLSAECGPDEVLRETLVRLLESERIVRDSPGWEGPSRQVSDLRFGQYRVTELIGAGGMGVVYAALRDDAEFAKKVAIKAIPPGMFTTPGGAVLRRERQILAQLEHPGIARLLDGGTTPEGVPWLAMEFVDGPPLLTWVRQNDLSTAGRVDLLLKISAALAYAHRQLVIHSDIKPSNILVDADGEPRLLDFGIARLIDSRDAVTVPEARPMTAAWASPEQLTGQRLTTASDIYSLGLILVALFLPEQRPGEQSPEQAALRLPGDLRFVASKAVATEPANRYATVEQFAADLENYLASRPVLARRGSIVYRCRRFVRRHRLPLAVAAASGIALTAAGIAQVKASRQLAHRLQAERKLASAFLLEIPDSLQSVPGTLAARQLLVRHAITYLDELAKEAQGDDQLAAEVAVGYNRIGSITFEVDTALSLHRKAVEMNLLLAKSAPGNRELRKQLADSLTYVGNVSRDGGDTRGSVAAYRRAAKETAALCPDRESDPWCGERVAEVGTSLGIGLSEAGEATEAVAELKKAVAVAEKHLTAAPADPERRRTLALTLMQLARVLSGTDDHEGELVSAKRARVLEEALLHEEPHSTQYRRDIWVITLRMGRHYAAMGNWKKARDEHEQGLALMQNLAAADPGDRGHRRGLSLNHLYLGDALAALKKPIEAAEHYADGIAISEALEREDPRRAEARRDLALLHAQAGTLALRTGDRGTGIQHLNHALRLYLAAAAADPANAAMKKGVRQTRETLAVLR